MRFIETCPATGESKTHTTNLLRPLIMKRTLIRSIAVITMGLIISGCAPFEPTRSPTVENELPRSFTSKSTTPPARQQWWKVFASPQLDALISKALKDNLSLHERWARLRQAGALRIQSGAALYPEASLAAGASASRQQSSNGQTTRQGLEAYSIGLLSNYEIDLWGRIRSEKEAAQLTEAAARGDLFTAAMTLSAAVAERWVRINSQHHQHQLLTEQLATNITLLELVGLRFENALASSLDVFQQRQVVEDTRSQLPLVERQTRLLEHELAFLLGAPPQSGPHPDMEPLHIPTDIPQTGIPAQLLTARPDVRAAFLRLQAANRHIDAARANRLPPISLSARAMYEAGKLDLLFDNWLLNLAGNLAAPWVDGQSRVAEVMRTRAVAAENLATYRRTILTAIKEVEDALVTEEKLRQHIRGLEAQLSAAEHALSEAGTRYRNGLNDYLPVLTALVGAQNLERTLIQRKSDLLIARINLYRSLGGTGTEGLVPPMME